MGKRKAYTPFSTSNEAGVSAAPVEGFIEVTQDVRPTIDTGFVDSKGKWIGHQTSDTSFNIYQKDIGIANGNNFITPAQNPDGTWPLDMTGYSDLFLAIKPSSGGNYAVTAIMGPADVSFANLSPVNAAATLKGAIRRNDFDTALVDSADSMTADVWNIFIIQDQLKHWKTLQFNIVNNSGAQSDIETAFLRLV